MTDDRFTFEPVYDLRTARVCGFGIAPARPGDSLAERVRGAGWSARQIADVDAGTAVSAVTHTRRVDPAVPIQVPVAADTVVLARNRLRAMLADGGVAPMLEVGPALAAAPADELVRALAELRGWGFRIALDGIGRGFGVDLLVAARPDVVALDRHLATPDPDLATAAVVRAVCGVAAASGVRVAATGVESAEVLGSLHASGARLARGTLLGAPRARPEVEGPTPPALLSLLTATAPHRSPSPSDIRSGGAPARPSPAPRVGPLPAPVRTIASDALTLSDDATADTVRTVLGRVPDSGGVVLLDPRRRPTGYLERSRFLLAMAAPFGNALWAKKPAITMADPPRVADERMPLTQAMELSLAGDRARSYDDLVLVGPGGACTGVVPVSDLWRRSMRRTEGAPKPPAPGGPGAPTGAGRPFAGPHPSPGPAPPPPHAGPLRQARTA